MFDCVGAGLSLREKFDIDVIEAFLVHEVIARCEPQRDGSCRERIILFCPVCKQ